LTLSLDELELPPAGRARARRSRPRTKPRSRRWRQPCAPPSNTLDLRGTRVDEALARLDAFLDVMMGEGETVGFVLHGHGTGAMKEAAREHLGEFSLRGTQPVGRTGRRRRCVHGFLDPRVK
jgi:DNA mismatch repair protein MutS2